MFNLIHNDSIIKVDFIVLKNDQYRQEEFSRRRPIKIEDFDTWLVSREDLILSKLCWARSSRSEMQLNDVANLLTSDCDQVYLKSWAQTLGVNTLLHEVQSRNE